MALIKPEQIGYAFNRPGHWKYVIHYEEIHQEEYTDKSREPDFIPEGHWEWIPSPAEVLREAAERFRLHWLSLSPEERERISKENEASLNKGFKIEIFPDSWKPE